MSVVAIATSAAFVATLFQHRTRPATRPVLGIAVTLFVGAVLHLTLADLAPVRGLLGIEWSPRTVIGGFWILVAFDLSAVVSGFWFLFALQYTGRDRRTSMMAHTVIGVLLVLLITPTFGLAVLTSVTGVPPSSLNAILGITLVLSESIAIIGVFLVLAETSGHKAFPPGQTALLTTAMGSMLVLPFAATTLQDPATTPVAVVVTSVVFTVAVRRYRIFGTLPVASVVSRDHVIEEMSEGVVMVDDDGRIQDLNPEAETLLGVERAGAVGSGVGEVLPSLPGVGTVVEEDKVEVVSKSGRQIAVVADVISDDRGWDLGHLLICHDVTTKRQQERRIGVLTQLLAGTIQDEMDGLARRADGIATGERPHDDADHVHTRATEIAALVARVRDVERALAGHHDLEAGEIDVGDVVATLRTGTAVTVTGEPVPSEETVMGDSELLTATLKTLATGVGRGTEPPELSVATRPDAIAFEVNPGEGGGDRGLADRSLEIARLAVEHTNWSLDGGESTTRSTMSLTLPVAPADVDDAREEGVNT